MSNAEVTPVRIYTFGTVFTARRYASAVYAVVVCDGVSVCPLQAGIVPKWLKVRSGKQPTIEHGL